MFFSKATKYGGKKCPLEVFQNSTTAKPQRPAKAKVLITVTGSDLVDHHVVIPLPKSYEEALVLVTDWLARHLGMNSQSQDFSLQYAMKSAAGNIVWGDIVPRLWKEVVVNGDELRLVKNDPQPAHGSLTEVVTFEFARKLSQPVIHCGKALTPRSYKATMTCALTLVKHLMQNKDPSVEDIIVKILVKSSGGWAVASLKHISDADWMESLAMVKREQSHIWFRVTETEHSANTA